MVIRKKGRSRSAVTDGKTSSFFAIEAVSVVVRPPRRRGRGSRGSQKLIRGPLPIGTAGAHDLAAPMQVGTSARAGRRGLHTRAHAHHLLLLQHLDAERHHARAHDATGWAGRGASLGGAPRTFLVGRRRPASQADQA